MQYSENLNFNLPEMTDPPDISKLIENWSNLDPIIQNIIIGLTQVGNAAKVNGYTVNANVPEGAKFTDTVTTINGKTGAITKADIVALGIPAQDTDTTYTEITTAEIDEGTSSTLRTITARRVKYILDKVQGWIGNLTKADVGLDSVDNVKQATKVEFDEHKADGASHSKTARFVIGTSTAGWTAKDCDYLCDGTND